MAEQNGTPEKGLERLWKPAFLAALRETGVIRYACEAADIGRTTAYRFRGQDASFAAEWDDAMQDAADLLELEAVRRARTGVRDPVIYQGKPCGAWVNDKGEIVSEGTPGAKLVPLTVTKYSDTLLMFLLKGARPEKYRDNLPADENAALGELLRGLIHESVAARTASPSGAFGQSGPSGEGGPAAPVADAPAPAPH